MTTASNSCASAPTASLACEKRRGKFQLGFFLENAKEGARVRLGGAYAHEARFPGAITPSVQREFYDEYASSHVGATAHAARSSEYFGADPLELSRLEC